MDEQNLVLIAKPMGVVGAVCPVTNPIVTPMCNAMFALKAGNAIIFAPHPKADNSTWYLTNEYQRIVREHGGPDHLVQTVRHGSVETTQALMKAVDVVVATGGGAMVKSAYSSGKPSYGVGAGNVPVIIDRGVDLEDAAEKITTGAAFDNGIICSHEQFVLAPRGALQRYDRGVQENWRSVVHRRRGTGRETASGRVPQWASQQGCRRAVRAGDRQKSGSRCSIVCARSF